LTRALPDSRLHRTLSLTIFTFPTSNPCSTDSVAYTQRETSPSLYSLYTIALHLLPNTLPVRIIIAPARSILTLPGHLHAFRFMMYHLYHSYTPASFSVLTPPNYPRQILDPFPFFILVPGVLNVPRAADVLRGPSSARRFTPVLSVLPSTA
jgi:hypothetical protein